MTEEKTVRNVFRNIPKENLLLETQERDGWTMFKMASVKWELKAG